MRSETWRVTLAATLLAAAGCSGGKQSLGDAPDAFVRELPEVGGGGPARDAAVPDADEPEPFEFDDPEGCCELTFDIAASEDGEVAVVLRGSQPPLDGAQGVPLTKADDTWTADVCLALDYDGTYYYEFSLPAELADGGVDEAAQPFRDVRVDEDEPVADDPVLGMVNVLAPRESCD